MTKNMVFMTSSVVIGAALILMLHACQEGSVGGAGNSPSNLLISSGSRNMNPEYAGSEMDLFVSNRNAFAFDLYHAIDNTGDNLFFSPYSISVALAVTYAGARNQTEMQIAGVLNFNFLQEKLHALFNGLDLDLKGRNQNDPANDDKYLKLNIANSIWGQRDYPFLNDYLDVLMLNYGAGIRLADFINNAESARIDINDWVAGQTENRIENLLAYGDITSLTRLVLANTIYFNASWGIPFDPDETYTAPFHLEDGSTVSVQMMIPEAGNGENGENFTGCIGPGYRAVQLPYYGGDFSMLVVVPDSGTFASFEQNLDDALIDGIIGNLGAQSITLKMPKFGYESRIQLNDTLAQMGMPDAFNPLMADFSGMDGGLDLFISRVIHQAYITLDEAGTEAAAATAVVMSYSSLPIEIAVDRPFIFMIRDNQTGVILFLGRVMDPSL